MVGFYDEISKRRVREHCTENGISSTLFCPAVTKKLRHIAGEKSLVNPYQKPQRLITRLVELFSNVDDWVLDLFSGTGIFSILLLPSFGLYKYLWLVVLIFSILMFRDNTCMRIEVISKLY